MTWESSALVGNLIPGIISTTLLGFSTNKLRDLFKFSKGSDQDKLLGETIAETFNTAQNAMSSYFDVERQSVENSLKLAERRLDADKRISLGHAQSAAEKDTIDREFAAKKYQLEKEAFEKNKKLQVAQAEINLAMQLSNLAVVAFAPNPLNIATLGAAGAIMYAVQAGLAFVNFGMNVSRISAAQFATGGRVGQLDNGRINGSSNIPTQSNGDNILATVKKGEVILNEKQQNALGGPATFASIGVPGFASGGFSGLGNFSLGENLRAPYNPSAYIIGSNNGSNSGIQKNIETLVIQMAENNTEVHKRIDNIKVQVVAREVETTNNNTKKASSIATL